MNNRTKYLLEHKRLNTTMMRGGFKLFYMLLLSTALIAISYTLCAQVPPRPAPPRLVNDLAGVFTAEQQNELEKILVDFNDTTSNQIAIVTVPELYGMDKSELAYSIGEEWKVGQKKFDNGVVVLIKPKTENERGDVFIATGYGLEGVLNDAVCRRIIERDMIPSFKVNDYYGAVVNALNHMLPLVSGEISTDEFNKGSDNGGVAAFLFLAFIVFIVIILVIASKNGPKNMGGGGRKDRDVSALDLLLLGSILNGGRHRSSGSFGGMGGFGGSSGGFGGFGGFGGGSFGGGGAGGSW